MQHPQDPATSRVRIVRRAVHGVLLLDKPLGLSSNAALQRARWLLRAQKAGHTGTLDPLATGVLPLCFGAATKFSQLHLDAHKAYEAVALLGVKTTTGDAEGEVLARRSVSVSDADLQAVALRFTGDIAQVPPMYSALKKDGRALYEYARSGVDVPREPRRVRILELKLQFETADTARTAIKILVTCSKGTYIRTLAEDIGEALGCGAHLTALRRTATGGMGLDRCVTLEQLEALPEPRRVAALLPPECLLDDHVPVQLDAADAGRFLSGVRRRGDWPDTDAVAVYGPPGNALLGTAHIKGGELIPTRLLSPVEVEQIAIQNTATPGCMAGALATECAATAATCI